METPPQGVLYYKFKKQEEGDKQEEQKIHKETELNERRVANRNVIETSDKEKVKIRFSDLPISKNSIKGLFKSKFIKMTEIQRASIPHALAGRDLVICSRTGSGKTLSYLLPIVEKLYRLKWSVLDGLGALILVPTRELAIQAFEVLK